MSGDTPPTLRVGQMLYGYCGGVFGCDSYDDRRVEAMGVDWVVARNDDDRPLFADCKPEELLEYTEKEGDEG